MADHLPHKGSQGAQSQKILTDGIKCGCGQFFFFLLDARTAQTGSGFSCRLQPQEKEHGTAWGRSKERGSAMGLDQGSEPRWSGRARRSRDARKECDGEETEQLAQVTASGTKTQEQKRARPRPGAPGHVQAREHGTGGPAATPRAAGRTLRAVPGHPCAPAAGAAGLGRSARTGATEGESAVGACTLGRRASWPRTAEEERGDGAAGREPRQTTFCRGMRTRERESGSGRKRRGNGAVRTTVRRRPITGEVVPGDTMRHRAGCRARRGSTRGIPPWPGRGMGEERVGRERKKDPCVRT
jgi:hypothetical protein